MITWRGSCRAAAVSLIVAAGILASLPVAAGERGGSAAMEPGASQRAAFPNSPVGIGPKIRKVMACSRYDHARWGLLVVDLETNRVIQQAAPDQFFPIASNTKLFTIAATLEVLGADHVFETPVVYSGELGETGILNGDLILIAQGDLTMGGRRNPDGTIAFTDFDHTDANALSGAVLTAPDPLGGLDDLAQQIAAAGIARVTGEVIIDDRLFASEEVREFILTPIIINDNLIDISILPQNVGETAAVEWRPQTGAFEVVSQVETVDEASRPIGISAETIGDVTRLTVTGEIAADAAVTGFLDPVRTYQVEEPADFARSLFIEALQRAGVTVDTAPLGANPVESLPNPVDVAGLPQVAVLASAPYAEVAKLILKVSHNLGAELSAMLIGVEMAPPGPQDPPGFIDGMIAMGQVLEGLGLDPETFAFADASGSRSFATPRSIVQLLRLMSDRLDFDAYLNGLPILGVDGSLALVQEDSPARGQVFAKTGTGVSVDFAHLQPFLTAKALAGYIDSAKGRRLAYALVVQNGVVRNSIFGEFTELFAINDDLGEISAIIWSGRH